MAAFTWVLNDASGTELRRSEVFSSKEDAEAWMGAEWSNLLASGAESVSLMEDDKLLYPMSLREA